MDYNKKVIQILGALKLPVSSAEWEVPDATFLVVENKRCLVGLDLQSKIGIVTKQLKKSSVMSVEDATLPNTEEWVSSHWRDYFTSK